ncbi:MAG: PDZ domain-containing protein, partial [Lactobacillus sp.]|nr:PDZ domain-containing protein [Lactobacillus sp.]
EVEAPVKKDETFIDNLDLYVREINADTIAKYHLDNTTKGVVVTEVMPTSDAVNKGLVAGDIIIKIDKKDVLTAEDVKRHVAEAVLENNRPVLLLVQSRGVMHFVALKLR